MRATGRLSRLSLHLGGRRENGCSLPLPFELERPNGFLSGDGKPPPDERPNEEQGQRECRIEHICLF